jgi:hypothetical protein
MTTGILTADTLPNQINKRSLRTAALIAGIGLLVMAVAAPFAELFVYPKLVIAGNAAETVKNISANQSLFASAIFAYLISFISDVIVAWALYVLLKPVHANLSLVTAWFRWVYTAIAVVALLNLVTISRLLSEPSITSQSNSLYAQVIFSLSAFKSQWYFGLLFFGIHLALLGYLVFRADYIPSIVGELLVIAGLGYLMTSLNPYLFHMNLDFAQYTFYGELIFMLWLLVKGSRIQEQN